MSSRLETIRNIRLEKIQRLHKLGIDPYPAKSQKDFPNQTVIDQFDKFGGKSVTLTGRLMSWREHGKVVFADLVDQSGRIQLFIKEDGLAPTDPKKQTIGFRDLAHFDIGDFIQATGTIVKTKTDQISIETKELRLLAKAIRPLPEKWEGVRDLELVFRRRYLDLVMNPQHRNLFERKARFWQVNREFMRKHGFIEIETPILEHVTGGADARPFVTHMNALDQDFYLRISTELYQKRVIGGGFEKVFTIGPNFRNEGLSDEHLPEYYQVEWYWAYADYHDNMEMVKEMFRYIAEEVYGTTIFTKGKHTLDLSKDWDEIDYCSTIQDRLGIEVFNNSEENMLAVIKKHGIQLSGNINRVRLIDNLWKIIRRDISGPAFLVNVPKFISPLAKSRSDKPELTERFQVILAGSELGNGYSELNDPLDQLARFREQQAARDAGDEEAQMLDIDYVEMLEYGMPPTSGYAHSERLFWTLENVTAREATLFPQLKSNISPMTKRIYGL